MALKIADKKDFIEYMKRMQPEVAKIRDDMVQFYKAKGKELPAGDIILASCMMLINDIAYPDVSSYVELRILITQKFKEMGFLEPTLKNTQDRLYLVSTLLQQAVMSIVSVVEDKDNTKEENKSDANAPN